MNLSRKRRKSADEIFVPYMVYMAPKELKMLKDYALRANKPATAIMREGMRIRLNGDKDPYALGYNDAIKAAIQIASNLKEMQIVMPSGDSILQLLTDKLEREYMEANHV